MTDIRYVEACLKVAKSGSKSSHATKTHIRIAENGFGQIVGNKFLVTATQKEGIKAFLTNMGIDWRQTFNREEITSRLTAARLSSQEKLFSQSIKRKWFKVKPLIGDVQVQGKTLPIIDGVHYELTDFVTCGLEMLSGTMLIVENIEVFAEVQQVTKYLDIIPRPVLAIYRGDPQSNKGVNFARDLKHIEPTIKVGVFADFDPAGIEIGLSMKPNFILLPDLTFLDSIESLKSRLLQPNLFQQQHHQYLRLNNYLSSNHICLSPYLLWLNKHKAGITQEHLIVNNIPLKVIFLDN